HRHASPHSTSRVETVHPLGKYPTCHPSIASYASRFIPGPRLPHDELLTDAPGGDNPTTGSAVLPIAVRREVAHAGDMNATHDNRTLRPPLTGALVYLLSNLPLGVFWFTLLLTLIITGASTAIIWVGIPISALAILLWRAGAQLERRRSRALLRTPVEEAYRPLPAQGHKQRWLTRLRDSTTWRDLRYLLLLYQIRIHAVTVERP